MRKILFSFILGVLILFPVLSWAADLPAAPPCKGGLDCAKDILGQSVEGTGLENKKSLEDSVATVVKGALSILGTVFFVLIIYAGYLWMTARGEESKVEESKKIIKAAIIGLIVVLSAYAITTFVTSKLTG